MKRFNTMSIPPLGLLKKFKPLSLPSADLPELDFSGLDIPVITPDLHSYAVPSDIPSTSKTSPDIQVVATTKPAYGFSTIPKHHFHLGNGLFVVVSDYTGHIRVHLRTYGFNNSVYKPTKHGITFSAFTFDELVKNIHRMDNLQGIIVIDKELFVSRQDATQFVFQRLFHDAHGIFHFACNAITMNADQMTAFQDVCELVWNSILCHVFGTDFKESVLANIPRDMVLFPVEEGEGDLIGLLRHIVKEEIKKINLLFPCSACESDEIIGNQLGHTCMTTSWTEKYNMLFNRAVVELDIQAVGKTFARNSGDLACWITPAFLDNIDASELVRMVKDDMVHDDEL